MLKTLDFAGPHDHVVLKTLDFAGPHDHPAAEEPPVSAYSDHHQVRISVRMMLSALYIHAGD